MSVKKRPSYEAPKARDLSIFGVNGQVTPQGSCEGGGSLTTGECATGNTPPGGTCSPNGFVPTRGYCRTGDKAVEGCTSGGIHH
jgi:hypothetical protein